MKSIFELITPEDIMAYALPNSQEESQEDYQDEHVISLASKTVRTDNDKSITATVKFDYETDTMVLVLAITDRASHSVELHQIPVEPPFEYGFVRNE